MHNIPSARREWLFGVGTAVNGNGTGPRCIWGTLMEEKMVVRAHQQETGGKEMSARISGLRQGGAEESNTKPVESIAASDNSPRVPAAVLKSVVVNTPEAPGSPLSPSPENKEKLLWTTFSEMYRHLWLLMPIAAAKYGP